MNFDESGHSLDPPTTFIGNKKMSNSGGMTIVRVKRKRTEDVAKALVLSFKRKRNSDGNDENEYDDTANEVFKFTATTAAAGEEDEETREHLKRIISTAKIRYPDSPASRVQDQKAYKLHVADVRMKSKREKEESVRRQRENLLLSLRAIDLREEEGKETAASIDSVSSITCNGQPLLRLKNQPGPEHDYCFDYYVSSYFCDKNGRECDDEEPMACSGTDERRQRTSTASSLNELPIDVNDYFNNLVAVYPYNLCDEAVDNEIDPTCVVNFDDEPGQDVDDDEDSNAESNWRNEYPDEDDEFDQQYDYYDQNYPSGDEDDGDCGGGLWAHVEERHEVVDQLRRLYLGGKRKHDDETSSETESGYGLETAIHDDHGDHSD